jgi:hypothetical protein
LNTKIASQLIIGRLAGYISNERKVFYPYFLSIVYSIDPFGRKLSQLDETLLFHSVLPHIKGSSSASAGTSSNHFCTGKLTSFPGHPGFYHIIDRTSITVGHQTYSGFKIGVAGKNHLHQFVPAHRNKHPWFPQSFFQH